jgi:hypothetical protein
VSVLVRSPSATRGCFLKASRYIIGSSEDSPCRFSSFSLADLPTNRPRNRTDYQSSACLTYFVTPSINAFGGAGIFNLLPIAYAFPPGLRDRLTQGRRTLPWKPWIFGEKDFHLLYRLLMPCIFTSMRSSTPYGIPSVHILRSPTACNKLQTRDFGSSL